MALRTLEYVVREWSGGFTILLPEFIVDNLTSPGQKDDLAKRYVKELPGFTEKFTAETIIELLAPYGAWTEEKMKEWSHNRLCETLLWVTAGNGKNGSDPVTYERVNGHRLVECYIGD